MLTLLTDELPLTTDLTFLALTAYREARNQPSLGQVAVCYSIIERVRRKSWFGNSILDVVTKKWQYSSLTNPKDPQLTIWPTTADRTWQGCLLIAYGCMHNDYQNPVPFADSYYDTSIAPPAWAKKECFVDQIGVLRFFNTDYDHEPILYPA